MSVPHGRRCCGGRCAWFIYYKLGWVGDWTVVAQTGASPPPVLLISLIVCTLLVPFFCWGAVAFWKNAARLSDFPTFSGNQYRVARMRAVPSGAVGCIPFVVGIWLLIAVPPHHHQFVLTDFVAVGLLAICAIDALILMPTIVLFNWPKAVVPPALRNQPGYLAARRHRRNTGSERNTSQETAD